MRNRRAAAWIVAALVVTVTACSVRSLPDGNQSVQDGDRRAEATTQELLFTDAERQALDELVTNGVLRVGVAPPFLGPGSSPGEPPGFDIALITAFADVVGVSVETVPVDRDAALQAPPDRADIYVPDVSLPDRLLRTDTVVTIPASVLALTVAGREMRHLGDLQRATVGVVRGTSHREFIARVSDELGLHVNIVEIEPGEDVYEYLRRGEVDFALGHSHEILPNLAANPDLNAAMALNEPEMMVWNVPAGRPELASAVRTFLKWAADSGAINSLFTECFGLDMDTYYDLIGYDVTRLLSFSTTEEALLSSVRDAGRLRVAMYSGLPIYQANPDGTADGLHYLLVLAMARALDIGISIEPVEFLDFFTKDGVVPESVFTDPGFTYVPDLLERIDVYAGPFTPLPWREQFLSFVSLYPSRLVYIIRDDVNPDEITTPGARLAMLADSSYESWVAQNLDTNRLQIITVGEATEPIRMVADREADFTIADANLALSYITEYDHLTIFPTTAEVETLSWAVARENQVLADILRKTMVHLQDTGVFGSIWRAYYGAPFTQYLDLLAAGVAR